MKLIWEKKQLSILLLILVMTVLTSVLACSGTAPQYQITSPTPNIVPEPTSTMAPTAAPKPSPVPAASSTPKQIVINAVAFLPAFQYAVKPLMLLADKIKEESKGELIIKVLGGPEIIPASNLPEAIRKGVVGMALLPTAFYSPLVPEAEAIANSDYSWAELRQRGYNDFMVQIHQQKMNVYYLGSAADDGREFFNLYTKDEIRSKNDLTRLKVAVQGIFATFAAPLGMLPVSIPLEDVSTAMDRGVINAYLMPPPSAVRFGLANSTKYVIKPGFQKCNNVILINSDVWGSLPSNLQNLIIKGNTDVEKDFAPIAQKEREAAIKSFLDAGAKITELSSADSQWYLKTIYDSSWKYVEARVSPDIFPKLKGYLSK